MALPATIGLEQKANGAKCTASRLRPEPDPQRFDSPGFVDSLDDTPFEPCADETPLACTRFRAFSACESC
jgi:hypothetical protein